MLEHLRKRIKVNIPILKVTDKEVTFLGLFKFKRKKNKP